MITVLGGFISFKLVQLSVGVPVTKWCFCICKELIREAAYPLLGLRLYLSIQITSFMQLGFFIFFEYHSVLFVSLVTD